MIELPPKVERKQLIRAAFNLADPTVAQCVDDINIEYEYWNKVKYKTLPPSIQRQEELWHAVKWSRLSQQTILWKRHQVTSLITSKMQQMCHEFDMSFGGLYSATSTDFGTEKERYLISSLMEEAISSSKMEGASTTRKMAKEMLRKKITPKDKSQQMIFNNYNTIRFIVAHKEASLSEAILLKIHALMTENTLENCSDSGQFRSDDQVVVEDAITHETVHNPPSHHEIPLFVNDLIQFFNHNDDTHFIHPIIKAITIHFMIGYMHPFTDGNGRTARALFYWYMLKNGYWLTEYLSISKAIAINKKGYEKAYLYSEKDNNDIGYFILYHLRVLEKAFEELKRYISRKLAEKKEALRYMRLDNINERQAQIVKMFVDAPDCVITVKDIQSQFLITPTTAKTDIKGLVEKGLLYEISFNKVKKGYIKSDHFEEIMKG